ncbi:MAG TPA: YdbH domain-containing protein [Sphingomonas sp.]|nr:YdbH domain-containing protein [Sphingomonas sp.]
MAEEGEEERRSANRLLIAGAIAGGLVVVALGAAWIERRPIVVHFVDNALADKHVPASYRITALGPFVQRLENVRIGDPAHPDLTAKTVELHLVYGLHGPHLVSVSASGVRLAARLANGKVSLGVIDRLLPTPNPNAPFALPDMNVSLRDARVRLTAPQGVVNATIEGSGNLSDGFAGHVLAAAASLKPGGCSVSGMKADLRVIVRKRAPEVSGPVALGGIACPAAEVRLGPGAATADMHFGKTLDHWRGSLDVKGFAGKVGPSRLGPAQGHVTLAGDMRHMEGGARLALASLDAPQGSAEGLTLAGPWRLTPGKAGLVFAGDASADHHRLADATRRGIVARADALAGTPLGPHAVQAATAAARLAGDARGKAHIAFTVGGAAGPAARVRSLDLSGPEGGFIRIDGGDGFGWNARDKAWRIDGDLAIGGGGLPALTATLHQPRAGEPLAGAARLQPYVAGAARLAMTPLRFAMTPGGDTSFATVATIDGPIGSGRVEGLRLPIAGRITSAGGLAIGEGCEDVGLGGFASGSIRLAAERVRLCGAENGAIVARAPGGALRFGASAADVRIAGRAGSSPLTLAADRIAVDARGLHAAGLSARLGAKEPRTALDIAHLDGRFVGGAIGGDFSGAAGHIGAVPLLLSDASGTWRVAGGALTVKGGLTVADARTDSPRFHPLAGRGVTLTLENGRIDATGALHEPKTGALVSDVTIRHDLASGAGSAVLDVPGLTFGKTLQPEMLTPLTLGVIANVEGAIAGQGRIDWDARGVTSTGDFHTDKMDLAAAFGPVSGLAGTIHFSDLLGLVTPPHQEATVAEINPGVAVSNGVVHYQLVGNEQVKIEGARWPFAGGELTLDPTLLSFGKPSERHLTFRVNGLDAAAFVQQLAFPNISATGTFDGVLPMIFDQSGGRIENGFLKVRQGGGTLAYVGAVSQADLGTMGKMAFDALKAIRYQALTITLYGRLDGEIVSRVQFRGVHQATGDDSLVARAIRGLPFRFNITIRAPFRGLLSSARAFVDPAILLKSAGPVDIQPAESETVR